MDTSEIFELLEKFDKSSLSEIIVSRGDFRLTLRKTAVPAVPQTGGPPSPGAGSVHQHLAGHHQQLSSEVESSQSLREDGELITSPIVGTFYRSASPDSPPFVEPGHHVEKGETLCIIEAMKVMNELQAEFDCEITDVLVENGTMIEFGAPLFKVKR